MSTEPVRVEFIRHDSWRADAWDDDVPSRPGWEVRCTACGILKPGWAYAEERTAKQVATRHLRSKHLPPKRPRTPNRTKAMKAAGDYWVVMCATCHHPGALHVITEWEPRATRCRCCADCPVYADGDYGVWSDERTAGCGQITTTPAAG